MTGSWTTPSLADLAKQMSDHMVPKPKAVSETVPHRKAFGILKWLTVSKGAPVTGLADLVPKPKAVSVIVPHRKAFEMMTSRNGAVRFIDKAWTAAFNATRRNK